MTFIEATRQNIVPLPAGAQAFSSGQPVSSTLPRAGYGSRVFVHVNGTMTITPGTGSASLSSTGPFSLLSRVGILVNAATDILSLSGYGCMCLDKVLPDADGAPALDTANPGFGGNRAYNAQLFQAGVASGANTWDFNLVLPIAINFQDPIGLLLLQSPETTAELRLTWNVEGGLNTNWPNNPVTLVGNATSAFSGNAFVDVEFFEVPARPEDRPDIRFLHTLTESRMALTSAGDNFVPLPRGNTYLRLMHNVYANAALDTADLSKLEITWNQTTKPYNIRPGPMSRRDIHPALSVTPSEDTRVLGTVQLKQEIQKGLGQNVLGQPVGWFLTLVVLLFVLHFVERHLRRGRK